MNEIIKEQILSSLNQLGWDDGERIVISPTKNPEHGDFSSNIAMVLSKKLDNSPMKIARKIQANINHPEITRIDVASPGFLNFFINTDYEPMITQMITNDDRYYAPNFGKGQSVYLEYVSANPTGPLHVGHGRSAAYGSSLANVMRQTGYNVHTEYYINDAGLQIHILTASMWLCLLKETVPEGCYKGQYLEDMVAQAPKIVLEHPDSLKTLLNNWSSEDQECSTQLIELCKNALGMNYSILMNWVVEQITTGIEQDLTEFGVSFTEWYKESSLVTNNEVESTLKQLASSGHTYEKDGALWFKSSQYGDEKDRVLRRSNGIETYFANDLAYHYHKCQHKPHLLINIFGADHHGYTPRIKAGLQALGVKHNEFKFILIQFAALYRGQEKLPMSTRSGQFITLSELYQEVGVDAARFFYCMRKCDQHLDFDLELAKSQNNQNPVYYIQYAHARIMSIFSKHGQYIPTATHWNQPSDPDLEIMNHLAQYPSLLVRVSRSHSLHKLPKYLSDLAALFHKYYNASQILDEDLTIRHHRLLLCHLTGKVLKHGLSLLHISAPESM